MLLLVLRSDLGSLSLIHAWISLFLDKIKKIKKFDPSCRDF